MSFKKSTIILIILLTLSISYNSFVYAYDTSEEVSVYLEDCIYYALDHNPEFLYYHEELKNYINSEESAFSSMLPSINVSEDLVNYINDSYETYTTALTIDQPLFQGHSLYTSYEISKLNREKASIEVSRRAQKLVLDVKKAWFKFLREKDLLKEAKDSLNRLKEHERISNEFFKEGRIWNNDLLQAQIKTANGEKDVIGAEKNFNVAKAKLNLLLHREIDEPIDTNESLRAPLFDYNLGKAKTNALENRYDLMQAKIDYETSSKSITAAKSDFWPSIDAQLYVGRTADNIGLMDGTEASTATISLDWKVWDWMNTKNNVDTAKNKLSQSNYKILELKNIIMFEVHQAMLTVNEAKRKTEILEQVLQKGEENYRVNTISFQEKKGSATDVLDAQDLLTTTRKNYINALSDFVTALADFEYSVGNYYPTPNLL